MTNLRELCSIYGTEDVIIELDAWLTQDSIEEFAADMARGYDDGEEEDGDDE